ncbi:MAG: ComEA family DNA-binding protein [Kocuria sp.]|nr:ComEA family DNA-binding protein [Kocuria sp.]
MSGVNYRGRARLRDQQATERLSALLEGVADRAEGSAEPDGAGTATAPLPEETGPQHREPVAVRTFFTRPAIVVLIAVLLVVCGISALSLLPGGTEPDSSVVAAAETTDSAAASRAPAAGSAVSEAAGAEPSPGASSGASGSAGAAGGSTSPMTVHVVGEVKKPAVVQLSPGARVVDAVEAAGGLTEDAVTERINLAQPVTDGQQVLIPNEKTAAELHAAGGQAGLSPGAQAGNTSAGVPTDGTVGSGSEGRSTTDGAASGGLINLNTATAADLEELPRVGPVLAQRIVDFRTEHGPFTVPEQLDDVSGIGPAMLEALLPLVSV